MSSLLFVLYRITVFIKKRKGLKVDKIAAVQTNFMDMPDEPQIIESIKIGLCSLQAYQRLGTISPFKLGIGCKKIFT